MKMIQQGWKNVLVKLRAIFGVVNWKDVLIRSLKTFVQAALAFASTALSTGNIVHGISQTLVLSALAAGIAAVWNGVLSPALKAVHEKADQEIGE